MLNLEKEELDAILKRTESSDDLQEEIIDLFLHLLNVKKSAFLYQMIKSEFIYHIVTGENGKSFITNVIKMKDARPMYEVNEWIKKNFKEDISIPKLAEESHMSISNFHQKFKNAIGMGPLQCQKNFG